MQSCGFEESLGSSGSEVTVSMVTKGFPQCLLRCAETSQSQVCVVSVSPHTLLTIHMDTAWEHSHVNTILSLDHFLSFFLKMIQLGSCPSSGGPVTVCCCWSDTLDVVQQFKRPQGWKSPIAGQTEGGSL